MINLTHLYNVEINFSTLFERVAADCSLDRKTTKYCLQRLKAEGLVFWTKTMPLLAKCILFSIENGKFTHSIDNNTKLTHFAWQGNSLQYFRSLLGQIFDLKSGIILQNPSATALRSLRQLCEYTYKLALDYDENTIATFEAKYEQTQQEVASAHTEYSFKDQMRKNAETYYPEFFKGSPSDILSAGPRFGPGAFASFGKQKFAMAAAGIPFFEWKLMPDQAIGTCDKAVAAHSGYFKPYPNSKTGVRTIVDGRECTVLMVPKDSRGPRVISKEPLHVLKPQMAFFSWASSLLERVTKNRINFKSQEINRLLALEASKDGKNATLDLKDASDMVSFNRVYWIFQNSPVKWLLDRCRSTTYKLPSGKKGKLNALAGMGSGLTFPILAFVVHLSICTSVSMTLGLPYEAVSRKVYVYGDDVIVPSEWYQLAVNGLTGFGLKVNQAKSYVNGPFRESCGGDYLSGIDVSPVRLKLASCGLPSKIGKDLILRPALLKHKNPKGDKRFLPDLYKHLCLQVLKHCQELRKGGFFSTAEYLESLYKGGIPMPYVGEGSPVLGIYTEDENLILTQGGQLPLGGGAYAITGVSAVPKFHNSRRACPYKFLGEFLKQSTSELPSSLELGSSSKGTVYGDIAIPRVITLKHKRYSILDLLPVQKEKMTIFLGTANHV